MRRFLYLSPYFPPQSRVGALRPLKFSRHLPAFGWAPVVLADLRASDACEPRLLCALDAHTALHHDYSRHAAAARARLDMAALGGGPRSEARLGHALRRLDAYASRQRWYPRPEWLPLGAHSLDLPHALSAARRVLRAHPQCEVIMVNADPYASLLLGRKLSRETGLPLVADLRDPWALCELRRPLRPPPQRALVDRMERRVAEDAAAFILNTETARADYVAHYHDLPSARFACVRNHADAELIDGGQRAVGPVFSALFVGSLRRFISGDGLLGLLVELKRREVSSAQLRLSIAGETTLEFRRQAQAVGVADMLELLEPVPYVEIGALMRSADLLIAPTHSTAQRIPAKVYDYLTTERPVLLMTDSPELRGMVCDLAGVDVVSSRDAGAAADRVQQAMVQGRQRAVARDASAFSSHSASAALAEILERVAAR